MNKKMHKKEKSHKEKRRPLRALLSRLPSWVSGALRLILPPVVVLVMVLCMWSHLAPIWRICGLVLVGLLLLVGIYRAVILPPCPCHMYVGKPGSGKSTLMVKLIHQSKKAGRRVVCTDRHIADRMGVEYVDAAHLLESGIRDCDVYIDEAGLEYDNRAYKNFSRALLEFFKLHRHLRCAVFLFSQQYDIDKKIRDVCDGFSLVKNFAGFWILERRVDIVIRLISAEVASDSVARIVDDLQKRSILRRGLRLHWAPRYWRLFDSYDTSRVDT